MYVCALSCGTRLTPLYNSLSLNYWGVQSTYISTSIKLIRYFWVCAQILRCAQLDFPSSCSLLTHSFLIYDPSCLLRRLCAYLWKLYLLSARSEQKHVWACVGVQLTEVQFWQCSASFPLILLSHSLAHLILLWSSLYSKLSVSHSMDSISYAYYICVCGRCGNKEVQ